MSALEAGLRGAATALLRLLAIMHWRDARRRPAARYGALFALCGAAFLIGSAPPLARAVWRAHRHQVPGHRRAMIATFVFGLILPALLAFLPGRILSAVAFGG